MLSTLERTEAHQAFDRWQRLGRYWESATYNGSEYDALAGGGVSQNMAGFGAGLSSKSQKTSTPAPAPAPIALHPLSDNVLNHNHTPFRPHSSNRDDLTLSVSEKHLMVTYMKVFIRLIVCVVIRLIVCVVIRPIVCVLLFD